MYKGREGVGLLLRRTDGRRRERQGRGREFPANLR